MKNRIFLIAVVLAGALLFTTAVLSLAVRPAQISASAMVTNNEYKAVTREYTFVAREVDWEIAPNKTFKAWTYNGTIPGPQIDVKAGDTIKINLKNELTFPVSIHGHGVGYNISNDGSYKSGAIVMPGETKTYTWTTNLESIGTWMYHDHVARNMTVMDGEELPLGGESIDGIEKGLYGAIIVRPPDGMMVPNERKVDREFVIFMDEYLPNYTRIEPPMGMEMFAGFNGKTYPANPTFIAKAGETVRFRLISIGTEPHTFHLHGHKWLDPDTNRYTDTKAVGPFERYTFEVKAGQNGPGEWYYHCHDLMHLEEGMEGIFEVKP